MRNKKTSKSRKIAAVIAGIVSLLLLNFVLSPITSKPGLTDVLLFIPPLIGGIVTGWLVRKEGVYLACYLSLPFLLLLLLQLSLGPFILFYIDGGNEQVAFDLFWMAFPPVGGFIGEKLYSKLHKREMKL